MTPKDSETKEVGKDAFESDTERKLEVVDTAGKAVGSDNISTEVNKT